jgi:hypothetical protein
MEVLPFGEHEFLRTLDFFEGRFESCVEAYLDVRKLINANVSKYQLGQPKAPSVNQQANLSTMEKVDFLPKVKAYLPSHVLITETGSSWCCAWANGQQGIAPLDHIEMAAQRMNGRFLRIVVCTDKGTESVQFILKSFQSSQAVERVVYVQHEGGWRFFQYGTILPFEKEEMYSHSKKRERLTPEMIIEYASAIGIHVNLPGFFKGRSAIVSYFGH